MEVGANEGSAQDHKHALKNKGHANFLTGTNMAKKEKEKRITRAGLNLCSGLF
jgi:hypothetical protein